MDISDHRLAKSADITYELKEGRRCRVYLKLQLLGIWEKAIKKKLLVKGYDVFLAVAS